MRAFILTINLPFMLLGALWFFAKCAFLAGESAAGDLWQLWKSFRDWNNQLARA